MKLNALVRVTPGFKAAVNIQTDLNDGHKISSYIPTRFACRLLDEIARGLKQESTSRSFLIHGAYGTGKSHLALTVSAFLGQGWNAGWLGTVVEKIRTVDPSVADNMVSERANLPAPLLVVPVYGSEAPTRQTLLNALDDSLRREGLQEAMPETAFHAAIRRIESFQSQYPDSVEDMVRAFRAEGFLSIQSMVEDLGRFSRDALRAFESAHPVFSRGARADLHQDQRPEAVYMAVSAALGRMPAPQRRSGIVVIWDEFGLHLESVLDDPARRAYIDFQLFVEACSASGPARLFFLGLAHRTVEQTVSLIPGLPQNQRDVLNRIAGRFLQRRVFSEPGEQFHLLSRVLLSVDERQTAAFWAQHAGWSAQLAALVKENGLFEGLSVNEIQRVVIQQTFPLHPATTFLLPAISERIAQNDRTLFHFMSDAGPDGLHAFLYSEPVEKDGQLNLVTTDRLYPFFASTVSASRQDEIKSIWTRFRKLPPQPNSMVQRILNTLLLFLIANRPELRPTPAGMALALGITNPKDLIDLNQHIDDMRRAKLIRLWPTGELDFRGLDSEVDLMEALETAMADVQAGIDYTPILQTWAKDAQIGLDVVARRHNQVFALNRSYAGETVTIAGLKASRYTESGAPRDKDGIVYWLIPLSDQELESARSLAERFQNSRVMVIVPQEVSSLVQLARKFLALGAVARKLPQAFGPAGVQRDEWEAEERQVQKETRERLKRAFSSFTAYLQGAPCRCRLMVDLEDLASLGMDITYPKSLRVPHEKLVETVGSDGQKAHRSAVIKALLESPLDQVANIPVKQVAFIVESTLKQTGWLREVKGDWVLSRPDERAHPNSAAVWDRIESFITSQTKKYASFLILIDDLTGPPFGLRPRTIPVLLAAMMRGHLSSLTFLSQSKPTELTADLVERMVREPQQITVLYAALTFEQRWIMEQFAEKLGTVPVPLNDAAPLRHVHRLVSRFIAKLPNLTLTSGKVSATTREIRDQILRPFAAMSGPDEDERRVRKYLFEDLPTLCGLTPLKGANLSAIQGTVGKGLQGVASELQTFLPNQVLPLLAGVFSAPSADQAAVKQAASEWLGKAAGIARDRLSPTQRAFVESVRKLVADPIGQVDELARALGYRGSSQWTDDDLIALKAAAMLIRSDLDRLATTAPEHVAEPEPDYPSKPKDTPPHKPPIWGGTSTEDTSGSHLKPSQPPEPTKVPPSVTTVQIHIGQKTFTQVAGLVLPPIVQSAVNGVFTTLNTPGLSPEDRLQVVTEVLLRLLKQNT